MNDQQQQNTGTERPATDRAEEMLNRLGQRFTDMRTNVGRALEQRAQQRGGASGQSSTGRAASETFGGWGERVGYVAGMTGLRLRQFGARAREEAEDLWAEAQSMRQQQGANGGTSGATDTAAGSAAASSGDTGQTSSSGAGTGGEEGPRPEPANESAQPS